jgi:hypothetical protein
VAGRSRTCAPRVSSGRSTGLSYDHEYERGWSRTSDLLFVRQALIPAELLAPNPGQGIEPRPPGSEPGVLPVRPSRSDLRADTPAPGRPPATQVAHHSVHLHLEIHAAARPFLLCLARLVPNDVFQATRPTLRPWIARPRPATRVFVEELWSRVRALRREKALVNQGSM